MLTPRRKVANGHGGLRAPDCQFTQKGTHVAPQIWFGPTECGMVSREHSGGHGGSDAARFGGY